MRLLMLRSIIICAGLTSALAAKDEFALSPANGAVINSTSTLDVFYSMIETAGLLQGRNASYQTTTVFAPVNAALALIPNDYAWTMLNDTGFRPQLIKFVLHQMSYGSYRIQDLINLNSSTLGMLSGELITVQKQQGLVSLVSGMSSAFITDTIDVKGDPNASNPIAGVVHILNNALMPKFFYQSLLEASNSAFFRDLVTRVGMASDLQTEILTIFMPTVDSFVSIPSSVFNNTALLRRVLRRHMVRGAYSLFSFLSDGVNQTVLRTLSGEEILVEWMQDGSWTANGLPVVQWDNPALNGVIHQVQGILGPKPTPSPTRAPTFSPRSLADVVITDDELSTFKMAVALSPGLNDTLNDSTQSNMTVLAPINTAFQNLDSGLVKTLFLPEWIAHLSDLVRLHVTDRGVLTSDVLDVNGGGNITMMNGERVFVSIGAAGAIFVSGSDGATATVTSSMIEATNGVLFKLDTALLPHFVQLDVMDVLQDIGDDLNVSMFVSMVRQLNLEGTLRSGIYTVLAPTNDALANLGPERLAYLLNVENEDDLRELVLYHVVSSVLPFTLLRNKTRSFVANNGKIVESVACSTCEGIGHRFNNVSVAHADLLARNGLAYVLTGVLDVAYNATDAPTAAPTPAPNEPTVPSNATTPPSNSTRAPGVTPNESPTATSGMRPELSRSDTGRILFLLLLPGLAWIG